jgi:hypothetical protein
MILIKGKDIQMGSAEMKELRCQYIILKLQYAGSHVFAS